MKKSSMLDSFLFVLIGSACLASAQAQCPAVPDPCSAGVYSELDDPDRSSTYAYDRTAPSDYLFSAGWYRSVSAAGGDMPQAPPGIGMCNAFSPVWLNGDIPSEADGVTQVQACAQYTRGICERTYDVQIKNCGEYRVYCLGPTSGVRDRYCMGTESPCPEGTTSPTGYTPNCQAGADLTLTGDPEITFEVKYESLVTPIFTICRPYYEFHCDVTHDDNTVFIDVQWYADDELVFEQVGDDAVAYGDLPAVITSDFLADNGYLLGTHIKCRVAARASQSADANIGPTKDAEFFAGVQVADSSQFMELEEGGEAGTYTGTYTLPYRCEFDILPGETCSDDLHVCIHPLDIGVVTINSQAGGCPAAGDVTLEIGGGGDRAGCVVASNEYDFSVQVHPNPDHVYNPRREMVLQLQVLEGHSNRFWAGAFLPRAQVAINDTEVMLGGSHCVISDDPHIQNSDGTHWWEIQLEGVFLMYRHRTLPISVEVYFRRAAAGYYTYNCGGAVRSGGQVFVYDACRDGEPQRVTLYECDEGLQQMTVTELSPTQYEILLPTGTRVILGRSRQYVYPSIFDWGQTEGLCGNFNGIDTPEDDKVIRGTNIVDYGTPHPRWNTRLEHNDFSNSWRIPEEETLYFGYVRDNLEYNNLYFCQCTGDNLQPGAECSVTPNVDCLAGDHPGASGFSHHCTLARKRRQVNVITGQEQAPPENLFPFDLDFTATFGTVPGDWTEATAIRHCEALFAGNANAQACAQVPGLQVRESIDNCAADILFTGSTALDQVHINVFTQLCKAEVARYDFESNTTQVITPDDVIQILDAICQDGCSGHGTCRQGVCLCEAGFAGVSCAIDLMQVPVIYDLPNGGRCDLRTSACDVISVSGHQFLKDATICKFEITDAFGRRQSVTTRPQYVHSENVLCPLDLKSFHQRNQDFLIDVDPFQSVIDVSVSNDGRRFSNVKQFVIEISDVDPDCYFLGGLGEELELDLWSDGENGVGIRQLGIEEPVIHLGSVFQARVTINQRLQVSICPRPPRAVA